MEDWVFTIEFGTDILNNTFGTNNLKGFGIERMDVAVVAAGGCLQYLIDTRHLDLTHIMVLRLDQTDCTSMGLQLGVWRFSDRFKMMDLVCIRFWIEHVPQQVPV